jgi:4-methyl-5(b-hydroxyethyl)-thiazole monophosphate biosynthesis
MRVLVPLAAGFEELEAVTILDVLRRGGVEVTSASLTDSLPVKGSRGITLAADATLDSLDLAAFDALVLPGGGRGTEALAADERVLGAVRAFDQDERFVAAICAAPTVLAKAGVLSGRRATCYPTCSAELGESYDEAPVIADGHIITSQGPGTAMLFSLVLVQHFAGDEAARRVADGLLTSF